MLKFLIYILILIITVALLPTAGCSRIVAPSTEEETGVLEWEFEKPNYLIEIVGNGEDTCLWTGSSYVLPTGEYWITVYPDMDSGECGYSWGELIERGEVVNVGDILLTSQLPL